MAALREVQQLQELARSGKVLAALELADIYRVKSLRELLAVICPGVEAPPPDVFDCVADAYQLKQLRDVGKRPNPVLKRD
jgi:hypothetical protein